MPMRLSLWLNLLTLFWAMTASAQLGGETGWVSLPITFTLQSPTNAPLAERYWFTNGIYHFKIYNTDGAFVLGNRTEPRSEQRFRDYTNGEIQYQSMEMAPSNENSYCIFQIHVGDAYSRRYGATTLMLFWFSKNGGSVRDYGGQELASHLGNKWFQLNVDHNMTTRTIKVWINRSVVWTQRTRPAPDFYFKNGAYRQDHDPTSQMDTYVRDIRIWTRSTAPMTLP